MSSPNARPGGVDLRPVGQRRKSSSHRWLLATIAVGGMLGASARYAIEQAVPHPATGIPWATLLTNVSACLLIGMLMVHVELGAAHPLLRPFLGVGVLGGYSTFSSVSAQVNGLLVEGRPATALAYLFGTLVLSMVAVLMGVWAGRTVFRARRWLSRRRMPEPQGGS